MKVACMKKNGKTIEENARRKGTVVHTQCKFDCQKGTPAGTWATIRGGLDSRFLDLLRVYPLG